MEKIKIENLMFTYPEKEIPVINNLSMTINSGEFVIICGKSGCGKSTLLRQLKPLIAPCGKIKGEIEFDGKNIYDLTQRQQTEKIGFVMQNPENQIVCDKVWHELAFGLEGLGYSNTEIRARVAEMAAFFGVQDWYYKNISELSGGQKQLLNLASVMVMQPSVLILDEPTSQLDPIAAHNFLDTVSKINRELGTTIIMSEHRLEEALPLADRVIVMDEGNIIADGNVETVGDALRELNSEMMLALPTPMRVYYSLKNNYSVPITIREGREWLSKMPISREIVTSSNDGFGNNCVLKVKDLWFGYEKNAPDILKGLSFEVRQGELYAIVGGNGAGKTTALSAIMGINKPCRGKVEIESGKKIAALPQNPQSLFVKNTVLLDLWEMLENAKATQLEKERRIQEVIKLCELESVLDSHPYDLSGGEQQRAALAKVLLCVPDIILLDEPTKGLDAHFKQKLAKILKTLQQGGTTIVMVSHDTEFCAKYAQRLGMLFDGQIVSEGNPREFFADKSFYTTAANRMARGIVSNAVLDEDIIFAIGGRTHDVNVHTQTEDKLDHVDVKPKEKKPEYRQFKEQRKKDLTKGSVWTSIIILLLIPLTIFGGLRYLDDRKYYLVSTMVLIEAMLPFVIFFEGRRPQARDLVIVSVMCGIGVVSRVAFAMLPQFKPVLAIVIITGLCLGAETGFLVGAITAFVSNFYFTQGPWTPWQMLALGLIGFFAGILSRSIVIRRKKGIVCVFGFVATVVIYGGIMNSATVMMSQENPTIEMFAVSFAAGFPLDLVFAAATALFLWLALEPMCEKLERVKIKYGLLQ